jgi:gas vesicle protein
MSQALEERVSDLEMMMTRVLWVQQDAQLSIKRLSDEMRAFKDEMRAFKDEMRAFKDEMKAFKDEMLEFKDEMRDFKDEMREEVKRMNKQWGELSNKLGTIVEDIVAPAITPILKKYFKCDPEEVAIRIKRRKGGLKDEFDAVAVCGGRVFLFEVKATPRPEYVREFKEKKANRFRELFLEHSDKELVLIFASIRIEEDLLNLLTKNRIYAMAYREWEYMDILNFDEVLLR